ncbi:MAG: CARDB domain-containing protein [Candidatus Peregrinibacteria bacterium]
MIVTKPLSPPPVDGGVAILKLIAEDQEGLITILQKEIEIIDASPNPFVRNEDITIVTDNVLAREVPQFRIGLHNDGGAAAETPLRVELDGAMVYEEGHMFPIGQTTVFTWSGWQATAGHHELKVTLDPDNILEEQNENDNVAALTFDVAHTLPPELTGLVLPDVIAANETFSLTIEVGGDQVLVSVVLEINGQPFPMTTSNGHTYVYEGQLPVGTYPFTVVATNEGGLVARLPGTLTVLSRLPDLLVSALTVTPLSLTNRDSAVFSVSLKNDGLGPVSEAPVAIRLDGETFHTALVSLGARSAVDLPILNWDAVSGSHVLEVVLDPDNTVEELDETNNIRSLHFQVGNVVAPTILSVQALDIVYSNQGFPLEVMARDSASLDVRAEIDGNTATLVLNAETQIYAGRVNAPTVPGDYTLRVVAENTDGLTTEWQRLITVVDSRPDLAISPADVQISPRAFVENRTESLQTVLHNHGGSDVTSVPVELRVDGAILTSQTVTLPKSGQVTLNWEWTPSFGVHDLMVRIDPQNQVEESDENNNTYVIPMGIADITPPGTPHPSANPRIQMGSAWSDARDWSIAWGAVEETSLKSYTYQIDGGLWTETDLETSAELHFDASGNHSVCVRAEDMAGNRSDSGCVEVLLDFAAPKSPVLYGGTNARFSSTAARTTSWSTPLDDSGEIDHYLLKVNGQVTEPLLSNEDYRVWPEGEHDVQVAAVDSVGHQSEWSNEITLLVDTTGPVAVPNIRSSSHPDPSAWYTNTAPSFSWGVPADALSGVDGYFYVIDQKPGTVPDHRYFYTDETSLSFANEAPLYTGVWYLHLVPVDKAGNKGVAAHLKFQIDLSPPYTTVYFEGINMEFSAADSQTGVRETHYRVDRGLWQQGQRAYLDSGKHLIEYYSVDLLGNEEQIHTADNEYYIGSHRRAPLEEGIGNEGGMETVLEDAWDIEPDEGEVIIQETAAEKETGGFFNVKAHYERQKTIISWNNNNPLIAYFKVYKSPCSFEDSQCREAEPFRKMRTHAPKRMRTTDWTFDTGPYYYQIQAYDESGRLLDTSAELSP